jgi:uncharacterized protein with NRDE domain
MSHCRDRRSSQHLTTIGRHVCLYNAQRRPRGPSDEDSTMCLLALLYRVTDAALVVGANREEYYQRGGDPPRRLDGVAAVGGVDPSHGGTWLGVNAHGLLVAVTNRRTTLRVPDLPDAPRSRGLLARELLALSSATEAAEQAARQLEQGRYAGCNFLCADTHAAVVVHAGDWLRVRPLPPGIHVLANRDVNDPTDARAMHARDWLAQQRLDGTGEALEALRLLCRSHEPAEAPMCFHLDQRGTVSSSLLALREDLGRSIYLHAQGAPDRAPYADVSDLLKDLRSSLPGG